MCKRLKLVEIFILLAIIQSYVLVVHEFFQLCMYMPHKGHLPYRIFTWPLSVLWGIFKPIDFLNHDPIPISTYYTFTHLIICFFFGSTRTSVSPTISRYNNRRYIYEYFRQAELNTI